MRIPLAVLVCAGLCWPLSAQVTLLDQPVAAAGVPHSFVLSDEGCDTQTAGVFQPLTAADDLVVPFPFALGGIRLWGAYVADNGSAYVNAPPPTESVFTVLIHADASGVPGGVVGSASNLVATRAVAFQDDGGLDWFQFDLLPPLAFHDPGTYWLEIFADTTVDPSPGCFLWRSGTLDPARGRVGSASDENNVPGSLWATNDVVDWSLVLEGEGAAASAEIPTLSTRGLIALALAIAAIAGLRLRSP